MCYYTITTDKQDKTGHLQAIMILDAKTEDDARKEYIKTFNLSEYRLSEGINIPDGFVGMLSESMKKALLKHVTGRANLPLVNYSNRIHMRYDED